MWHLAAAALIGIWMMVAPWLLHYEGTSAESSARIAGPLIVTFAVTAWWQVLRGLRFVALVGGVWLVVAPLVLPHGTAAAWNSIAAGAGVVVLAAIRGKTTLRYGGGWRALLVHGKSND